MMTLSYPIFGIGIILFSSTIFVSVYCFREYNRIKHRIPLLQLKLEQAETQLDILNQQVTDYQEMTNRLNQSNIDNAALKQKLTLLSHYEARIEDLDKELNELRYQHTVQFAELSELKTRLEETRLSGEEKLQLLTQSEVRLTQQFENVAHRIFSNNSKKLEEQNSERLHHLLSPLKEQLEGFKKQVQDSFTQEAKERHTLTHEIQHLHRLNQQMTQEAINLTNALKGNNKMQGNWGEVILNRILESSGLREGHEYETQVSLQNETGKKQQPDVIVHLPQGKDIIIDAKMTLVAYERYFNSDNEEQKQAALRDHIMAFKHHIKQLSYKNYHHLEGVNSLDYILMFVPVEPAFLVALDHEPTLINDALKNNILLVSPTTLLASLRTISTLWGYENRNRHAQEIAERAAKLYDKMRGFVEDMESLGTHLKRSERAYSEAFSKLAKGRGNALGQIEQFRYLGIPVKKPIPEAIAKTALEECYDYTETATEKNVEVD